MASTGPQDLPVNRSVGRAAQVVVVSSVMFTFISFWRTAAVVLCDMSSTVYYIGAIVENAIGKAAPWFILAVLLFSYAMRAVYIESCALFVRGGVYRVVKEAMGGFLGEGVRLGPVVRLCADRAHQRRFRRTIHRRPGFGNSRTPVRTGTRRIDAASDQELGLRRDCLRGHALLLAPEPARHSRVERQGA